MTARTLHQLHMDGETKATLRDALDRLDELKPQSPNRAREILKLRDELTKELRILEGRLI